MIYWDIRVKVTILLVIWLSIPLMAACQLTKIQGLVTDAVTGDPIPFVNISFQNTNIGISTNFEGEYSLETKNATDTLIASYIGYATTKKRVLKNRYQVINFELEPTNISLAEVVITYKGNPAEILLRKIIQNKENNKPDQVDVCQYEAYNKIQFDINNITEDFKDRRILKPFRFIFNYIDTSTVNGKNYLPVFLSESVSDIYFRKKPKSEKEIIKATKVSGVENESISQLLGDMYQNYSIYDNHIVLFDKNFVSPIANYGLSFYKYYLIDSSFINNKWCYNIMFKPKRKQELTFTGNFWVHDTTFAIKKYKIQIVDDANLNYLNDVVISQEFDLINNQHWMTTKDQIIADFNIMEDSKSLMGFFGRKTSTYRNYIFDSIKSKEFYAGPVNIIVDENSLKRDDEYWENARHEELTKDEKTIYFMIDTLKSIPAFQNYVDIVFMMITGYYVKGDFEVGPYMSMYSFNAVEGNRVRIGGRTSNEFSTKLMFDAYIAYGTKDKKLKYKTGFVYMLSKNPRRSCGISYKSDIEQLSQSSNAFREDFLLASIFRTNPLNKLSLVKEFESFYEHEWFQGFSNTIYLRHKNIFSVGSTPFIINNNITQIEKESITNSEITFDTRFAYNEKFVMGEFERSSLGTKYPVLQLSYTYGLKNVFNSDFEYHKLRFGIHQWFNIGTFGWSKYILETGKTWGTLPYPLLQLHEGNETWFFDPYAYNLMNYFEFVSDQYFTFSYTHHFDGFFLNRIPLMRKLKWREVVFFKGLAGTLDNKNKTFSVFPENLGELNQPYFESGVGIENILTFIRIDAVWRLSHLDNHEIRKFGIMGSFQFTF